jgi:hypothetical protein
VALVDQALVQHQLLLLLPLLLQLLAQVGMHLLHLPPLQQLLESRVELHAHRLQVVAKQGVQGVQVGV